jgi:hypothetical protein
MLITYQPVFEVFVRAADDEDKIRFRMASGGFASQRPVEVHVYHDVIQ